MQYNTIQYISVSLSGRWSRWGIIMSEVRVLKSNFISLCTIIIYHQYFIWCLSLSFLLFLRRTSYECSGDQMLFERCEKTAFLLSFILRKVFTSTFTRKVLESFHAIITSCSPFFSTHCAFHPVSQCPLKRSRQLRPPTLERVLTSSPPSSPLLLLTFDVLPIETSYASWLALINRCLKRNRHRKQRNFPKSSPKLLRQLLRTPIKEARKG